MSLEFSDQNRGRIDQVLSHYPNKQAALLPVLWIAQEQFGWLSPEVMELVARRLELSPAHVYGVATFYTMFHKSPPGKFHWQVCNTLPCALVGSETVLEHLKRRLGIEPGETTPDGRFSLTAVECLASCGTGPMARINETYYENLTEEKIDGLLEEMKK